MQYGMTKKSFKEWKAYIHANPKSAGLGIHTIRLCGPVPDHIPDEQVVGWMEKFYGNKPL